MATKADNTKQRLLESAKTEFLEKGFSAASLRTIAGNAGVTTGALYGYFSDKETLFATLVGEHAAFFEREFRASQTKFFEMDAETQRSCMGEYSSKSLFRLVDYMYDHLEAFRLLLCSSTGTPFEHWLEPIIACEEESTHRYIEQLRRNGFPVKDIGNDLIHILCSGCFHDIMEPVIHNMDRATAIHHITLIWEFCYAGWDALLGTRRS